MQNLCSRGAMSAEVSVLIVGAGPTGLTLACDLARRGVDVRVVDKNREPFVGSRGKGLQPRTLEIFEDLGIIDRVLAQGAEYPPLRVHTPWFSFPWHLQRRDARSDEVPYPNVWLLPQASTEAILRARLAELGGAVECATELASFRCEGDRVTATLIHEDRAETLRARYLVGADGGHSLVRKAIAVPFLGGQIEQVQGLVGDVHIEGLDRDHWHVWPWTKSGLLSICPLPHCDLFQLFAEHRVHADVEVSASGVDASLRHALGSERLRVREARWLSLYRPQVRLAERYRVGSVFLAGDAAHVHPPTGAQGLNLGVQDAYNLGWKLAAVLSGANERLLDSYEEERRPVAARALALSTAFFMRKWSQRGAETKQLGTNYRGGSLAAELPRAPRRLRAGDRAPDALWMNERGTAQRLFHLVRGPQPVALAFGPNALRTVVETCRQRAVKVLHVGPQHVRLRRAYGAGHDDLAILRPDGYIGLLAHAPSCEELSVYLDRIGAPGLAPVASTPGAPAQTAGAHRTA